MAAASVVRAQPSDSEGIVMTPNEKAVISVLEAYSAALNASDTSAVMPLYTEDGVFMPPYSPSAIGREAVRTAYDSVFAVIKLSVKFTVAEVVEMCPGWVFARTNSAGSTVTLATGTKRAEANQELFVFHRESDGRFRIARYSFSTTNPPAA